MRDISRAALELCGVLGMGLVLVIALVALLVRLFSHA